MPGAPEFSHEALRGFFEKLSALYAEMDRGYARTAAAYGFDCRGCADNCCRTRFHHHTRIEAAYLLAGVSRLEAGQRQKLRTRAKTAASAGEKNAAGSDRRMCPANSGGWCLLYPYRPMICRLHGLAHELNIPGRPRQFGPGCAEFERICGSQAYIPFDRTPFYAEMAALEKEFSGWLGSGGRFRRTVAEIIVDAERMSFSALLADFLEDEA